MVTQFANARWHTQYNVLMRSRHDLSRCKGIDASGSPIQNGDQFQIEHSTISVRHADVAISLTAIRKDGDGQEWPLDYSSIKVTLFELALPPIGYG